MDPQALLTADVHDPHAMRQAGAAWLSLALMDARNRTLGWLAALEGLDAAPELPGHESPLWWIGQVGWFQERWIARNLQRRRGSVAEPQGPQLASIEPNADRWFAPGSTRRARRRGEAPHFRNTLRDYLAATLEATLELLEKADDSDTSLHAYRVALLHEDRVSETLASMARSLESVPKNAPWSLPLLPNRRRRDGLGFASQAVLLGTPGDGFAPDNERPCSAVEVPEFEIDAQPVCWAQYAEFASDGGYDDAQWWSVPGWNWLQASQRRAPRYVEQMGHGVLLRLRGQMQRAPAQQSVQHVSWFEADAFCRWAGRRLPTEAEWAAAIAVAGGRGFAWGDGFEWLAGTARAQAGQVDSLAALDAWPGDGGEGDRRVLRGASLATVPRQRHPGARRLALATRDDLFCGFRSCAL